MRYPAKSVVICTEAVAVTEAVWIAKYGEYVVPAGENDPFGACATAGWLLVSFTTAPPGGPGRDSVNRLFVVREPPFVEVGDRLISDRLTGYTVKFAIRVAPP